MPNDFYSEDGGGSDADENGAGALPDQEEKAEGETALLPKSIFGNKPPEPGATCTFKVVHVYDDEVEVEYQDQEKGDESELGKADNALAMMGQPPEEAG